MIPSNTPPTCLQLVIHVLPPFHHMPPATPTERQPSDSAPTQWTRSSTQPSRAAKQEEGEHFALDDVSSSDDDNEVNPKPPPHSRARNAASTQEINDPEIPSSEKGAKDVNYFFEKTAQNKICQPCQ